jgi:GNAT superfamily N-acetyltransferase
VILRDADRTDLEAVYDVWYATETDGIPNPPPPRAMPWFGHLLDVGRLVVADEGSTVIGFAGLLELGSCVALSDLFVHPDRQSHGVGAMLLDEILPAGRPCVTMASADPRAVASYARRGMRPRWPAYYLSATAEQVGDGSWPALGVRELSLDEYDWPLPGDVPYHRALGARPLAIDRAGVRVGTALVVDGSPQRIFHPDTTEVLETTVDEADDAAPVVLAVVADLLQRDASRLVVQVPGPHGALSPLLERGFAITDVDTACASEEGLLADPTRHTMHGESRVALRSTSRPPARGEPTG